MSNSKPVRVAQIMGKLWGGGVEAVVYNYYREIDKNKIQFDFYFDADSTVEPPQELINMGARFFKIPPYQKMLIYMKTLRWYFEKYNYTIVHSHINTLSIFPLLAAWSQHIPVRIAHNHSVPGGNEFRRNTLKLFLRKFAKIFSTDYFACSEKAGRWLFGDKSYEEGEVFVVKNAVNFGRLKPKEEEIEEYKEILGLENKFVIGHIGRFTYAKNHSFLIDIFYEICKVKNNAVLMLIGDGELHDEIVAKICEKNLEDKVVFVGQVSNPEKYYRLVDVIVMPSLFEGLSLTTIESQIAGIPIVISDAIPVEAIISNGCQYHKLADGVEAWAKSAIKVSNTSVVLNEKSKEYDIENRAELLTEWYLKHI